MKLGGLTYACIGFGEAGSTFANDRHPRLPWQVFDRLLDDDSARAAMIDKLLQADCSPCPSLADVASRADVIMSLVTADQALKVARDVAEHAHPDTLFLDFNSVSPNSKLSASKCLAAKGIRYADVAVMSPVQPAAMSTPLLISGLSAEDAAAVLSYAGFRNLRIVGQEVGRASSIKMIRSVVVKGIEALSAECVLAASKADVLSEVLASLDASEVSRNWSARADYNLDRMLVHGMRRAAEMREVVTTLEDLGVSAAMTRGTVERQTRLGSLSIRTPPDGLQAKLEIISQHPRNQP